MLTKLSTIDSAAQEAEIQPLVVFTICSKNFTAYAKTLFDSVREFHPEAEQYMCLCDEVDSGYDPATLPFNTILLQELEIPGIEGMAKRYNITEFNTAIKPFAFSYLFKRLSKQNVVYIDPDIMLTSRMEEVEDAFSREAECILTPHILQPAENVEIHDQNMLKFGIYNLGFIGLRHTKKVIEIIEWWGRRLQYDCVIRIEDGLFVDQKWADLFPAFIPGTVVLHHEGYNVAYWNLSQRQVRQSDGKWYANEQPLRFVHFSGNKLNDNHVFSRHAKSFNRNNIGDLRYLLEIYRQRVYANGHANYSKLRYSFNWNGATGFNAHTPKAFQFGGLGIKMIGRKSFRRIWSYFKYIYAASRLAGGWTDLAHKAIRVFKRGGLAAVLQRVSMVKSLVNAPSKRYMKISSYGIRSRAIPKLFVTDWSTPRPDQDAGSVTTFYLLKILVELGYDVTFIPSDLDYQGEYTDAVRRLGVRCLHKEDIGSVQKHLKQFGSDYSAFILFRAPIAAQHLENIRKYAPNSKVVFETVDLHYLRDERAAHADGSKETIAAAQRAKDWELGIIAGCDVSIVLSSFEKELLTQELPGSDIRTMPLLFLDIPLATSNSFDQRKDILFIGGFRHRPNVDAMIWFCHDIWPLVHQRLPDAQFHIIGSYPTADVLDLAKIPGVMVLGHVKDLDPVFGAARLSVAPLRYGAGIKGKVATSLGYGVPVVGTHIAFEGMELSNNEHVMIADDVATFVEAIVRAYSDATLWSRLSTEGFKRIYDLYSESAGRQRVKALMDSLGLKSSDFEFHRFRTYGEYQNYKHHAADENRRRLQVELDLIPHDAESFFVDGYCAVCQNPSKFQVGFMYSFQNTNDGKPIPNWREHLNCVKCGYVNRIRLILHLLRDMVRPTVTSRIYITEQTTPLYKHLKSQYPLLMGSEYLGDSLPLGGYSDGLRNEDMTHLSFSDESFDLILSCDVLEHVSNDLAAFAECFRCLAPGGTLVFMAPCHMDKKLNTIRARIKQDGTIEHLINPPEYHGNPVDPENGALCFRYFGWEVIDQLKSVGFDDAQVISVWSRDLAYLGGEQIVFVATKGKE